MSEHEYYNRNLNQYAAIGYEKIELPHWNFIMFIQEDIRNAQSLSFSI